MQRQTCHMKYAIVAGGARHVDTQVVHIAKDD